MKYLLVVFIIISSDVYGLSVEVYNSSNDYSFVVNEKYFSIHSKGFNYKFDIKNCNRSLVEDFVERYKIKKNKMRYPASVNKSKNIKLWEGQDKLEVHKVSTLGKFLVSLPRKAFKLSIEQKRRCSK